MSSAILLKGLPASGKSTWANEKIASGNGEWVRVCRDDLRWMLHQYKFSNTREKLVMKIRNSIISEIINSDKNLIVDETFLNPKTLLAAKQFILARAKDYGKKMEIEVKEFDVSLQTCIVRDRARANSVGEGVIRRMHSQFVADKRKGIEMDETKPWAVLCDLDGTIADISHRDPYDGGKCLDDKPRHEVVRLVDAYAEDGDNIIFLSARDDAHYEKTLTWLQWHVGQWVKPENLLMRVTGDKRDDAVVKEEILREKILPEYQVKAVIDDRPKVIRMWRDLGLFVFDVGDGIEF